MNLTAFANKYSKYKIISLFLGVFLLGFSIRYLAAGPRIGPELDTWFHYRMAEYFIETGKIPQIDPLGYYPTGRPVWKTDLLGLPHFIGITYKIAAITGITLMDYMVAFPAIFTSLVAIPLYLLTKELTNKKTGLFTALLWQVIPSTMTRTHAGFVDKESLGSIYIFLWLWLLFLSIKKFNLGERRTYPLPFLSGLFMALSSWTWGGTAYFILVISVSAFLYTLLNFNKLEESFLFSIIIMASVGALTMWIIQPLRFPLRIFYKGTYETPLTVISFIYIFVIIKKYLNLRVGEKKSQNIMGFAFILLIGGASYTRNLQNFMRSFYEFAVSKILVRKSLITATVSENLAPNCFGDGGSLITRIMGGDCYAHFSMVLLIAPIGGLLILRRFFEKKDYTSLFILIFALSGALGMRNDIRLGYVLTPSFAILTAYGATYFLNYFREKEEELKNLLAKSKKKKIRYKAEANISNIKVAKLLVIVIIFGVIASPTFASFSMLNGRKVDVPVPWYNAMMWIKDNTPEDAVIVSWWDYGYWEQALAKRRTVVDGGNSGPLVYSSSFTEGLEYRGTTYHRDVDMAKMFTSPEEEALKYLRPYVDFKKVPTYVIVSYEEFGKSGAINHISQCNCLYIFPQTFPKSDDPSEDQKVINDFINNNRIESFTPIINFGSYWQMWFTGFDPNNGFMPDPDMKNRLLPKLLPISNGYGQGLDNFELVYQDEWGYVLIYKIV